MRLVRFLSGGVAALLLLAPVRVDAQARRDTSRSVTLYVWAAGAGGTIQPAAGGPVFSVDRSFSDLQQDLAASLFLAGLVRSGRLTFLGDLSYFRLARQGQLPAPGIGPVQAVGRFEQTSLTLEAGYQVVQTPSASLDLLGGVRTWWLNASALSLVASGVSGRLSGQFTDPLLAARGTVRIADRWSAMGYVDGGGFGVGSEATSQLVGTLSFEATRQLLLSTGYRHLAVDYRKAGRRADITSGGPVFGATLRF